MVKWTIMVCHLQSAGVSKHSGSCINDSGATDAMMLVILLIST